jgi:Mg-chelatase subunit ChlD
VSVLIEGIPPEDTRIQFAVVSFGDIARTEIPLTFDYPKLLLSVEEYKKKNATGSSTYLVPGIQLSRKILKDSENSVEHLRIIIVLTDGDIHDDEGLGEFIDSVSDSDGILFFTLGFGSEKIIPDIKDPLFRSMYLSYMDINDSLLIRISNGQYFQNNTFRLRDTIRKLGACL